MHRATYDALTALAPAKPIMIAETASTEVGGSKAAWITDALQAQLPVSWPRVKAVLWFNWNHEESNGTMDWVIESSASARAAFAAGISSPYYAANTFGGLPALTKVTPIGEAPAGGRWGSGLRLPGRRRRAAEPPDPLPGRAAPLPPGAGRLPAPGLARRSAPARPGALLDPHPGDPEPERPSPGAPGPRRPDGGTS